MSFVTFYIDNAYLSTFDVRNSFKNMRGRDGDENTLTLTNFSKLSRNGDENALTPARKGEESALTPARKGDENTPTKFFQLIPTLKHDKSY